MFRSVSSPSSWHNALRLQRAFPQKNARRVYQRFPCDVAVGIWRADASERLASGKFLNIGMGGALLKTRARLDMSADYVFQAVRGQAQLILPGRVARAPGPYPIHYGVSFRLNPAQERALKLALDVLRPQTFKPSLPDDKVRWYWGY